MNFVWDLRWIRTWVLPKVWSRGNILDLYSVSARFESRQGHRLAWDISWYSSVTLDKCWNRNPNKRQPLLCRRFPLLQ
jgi:hypothetical protein